MMMAPPPLCLSFIYFLLALSLSQTLPVGAVKTKLGSHPIGELPSRQQLSGT